MQHADRTLNPVIKKSFFPFIALWRGSSFWYLNDWANNFESTSNSVGHLLSGKHAPPFFSLRTQERDGRLRYLHELINCLFGAVFPRKEKIVVCNCMSFPSERKRTQFQPLEHYTLCWYSQTRINSCSRPISSLPGLQGQKPKAYYYFTFWNSSYNFGFYEIFVGSTSSELQHP